MVRSLRSTSPVLSSPRPLGSTPKAMLWGSIATPQAPMAFFCAGENATTTETTMRSPRSTSPVLPSPGPLGSTPKAMLWGSIATPQAPMAFFCAGENATTTETTMRSLRSTSPVLSSPRPLGSTPKAMLWGSIATPQAPMAFFCAGENATTTETTMRSLRSTSPVLSSPRPLGSPPKAMLWGSIATPQAPMAFFCAGENATTTETTMRSPRSTSPVLSSPRPLGSTPKAMLWGSIATPQAPMAFFCAGENATTTETTMRSPRSTSPVLPSPGPLGSTPKAMLWGSIATPQAPMAFFCAGENATTTETTMRSLRSTSPVLSSPRPLGSPPKAMLWGSIATPQAPMAFFCAGENATTTETTMRSLRSTSPVLPSPGPLGSTPKAMLWGSIATPQAPMAFFCAGENATTTETKMTTDLGTPNAASPG